MFSFFFDFDLVFTSVMDLNGFQKFDVSGISCFNTLY